MIWHWLGIGNPAEPSGKLDEVMDALRANSRPCVLLRDGEGNSKIGGMPDGLSAEDWPSSDGKPLSFLAQLDLDEIRQANGPDWLPASGSLLFFYDADEQPWGFDPKDRDGWSVVHQSSDTANAGPHPGKGFAEKRVRAIASRSLPDTDRIDVDMRSLNDEEFDQVCDAMEQHYEGSPGHQVGGFPSPIQGDHMELEAQLASNGIYCGDPSGYESSRAKELASGAKDWVLLLQLDSDEDTDMMWGDGGRLYFWIREQDARDGDFSNVWLVLQCS